MCWHGRLALVFIYRHLRCYCTRQVQADVDLSSLRGRRALEMLLSPLSLSVLPLHSLCTLTIHAPTLLFALSCRLAATIYSRFALTAPHLLEA
jgi:hypothetical protein